MFGVLRIERILPPKLVPIDVRKGEMEIWAKNWYFGCQASVPLLTYSSCIWKNYIDSIVMSRDGFTALWWFVLVGFWLYFLVSLISRLRCVECTSAFTSGVVGTFRCGDCLWCEALFLLMLLRILLWRLVSFSVASTPSTGLSKLGASYWQRPISRT